MALFNFKKKKTKTSSASSSDQPKVDLGKKKEPKKEVPKAAPKEAAKQGGTKTREAGSSDQPSAGLGKDLARVLLQPRITEKATLSQSTGNVYVFNVDKRANKHDVADAVEHLFKVVPLKVNITKVPSKKVAVRSRRGKSGVKSGGKKAYVYLKKGDSISIV
ncbi:MAG: 50S ribosomal protein L23 [Parcubacteria group bacterium]|nr:50S ribosomal protein L23 [Parcubacteria group bacterium]